MRKKYVSALIVPCFDSLEEYAKQLNIKYHDRLELLKNSEILKMFEQRINALQKELAHFEQVKKFTLLSQAFSIKLGEITPTLKLRRKVILERYRKQIGDMYNSKESKKFITKSSRLRAFFLPIIHGNFSSKINASPSSLLVADDYICSLFNFIRCISHLPPQAPHVLAYPDH